MSRIVLRVAFIAALPLTASAVAQNQEIFTSPPTETPGIIYTPEIQLGSADQPSVVTEPSVTEEVPGTAPGPSESNATPANTQLLSERHFDFITSPMEVRPGSMEDHSISLGEYARQLRAQKQNSPTPNAIAKPTDSR